MTYNTGESLARASVEEKDVNVGIAFGGKEVEKKQDYGYGGHTEQEGGISTGSGNGGTSLEADGGSTGQNSSIHS